MKRRSLNILLINQYYPPDTSATADVAQMIAEALSEKYQVTVLAGRPSYNPKEFHPWYLFRRVVQGKVVIQRVGSTAYPRDRIPWRLANYLSYLLLAILRALTINVDVILGMTDPPLSGLVGVLVAHLRRRPFLYSIQDLHPDMALASGLVQKGLLVQIWEKLHCWVLRRASLILVLGEDMRERVIAKGINPEKVEVLRHGVAINEILVSPDHPVAQEIRCGFSFAVVHAGNLGFYGAWDTLIEAARLLDGEDVGFIFVGDGAAKPMIKRLAFSCDRVRFLPFRPSEEVPYVLAAGDIHVVTIRRGLEGMVVPSKIYPILAAGRPVLAVAPENSDVAQIVVQKGCGIVADPDDPFSVAAALRSLIGNRARLTEMSRCARTIAPEYEREKYLKCFVGLIEKVSESQLSKGKIKVLRIIARLNIGGPSIHVHLLTKGLDARKFEPTLVAGKISPQEGDMSYLFDSADKEPIIIPEMQREISLRMDLKAFQRIFSRLIEEKPDIVHTHTAKAGSSARLAVLLYNLIYGKKVRTVHTFHGHVFEGYFSRAKSLIFVWIERLLARLTDVIIAISDTQKKDLTEKFHIAPAKKINTVELGFELKPFLGNGFLKGQFRQRLGIRNDTILIGIVGRLVPIKNHRMFFEAAKLFVEQNPGLQVKFMVVGDGELRSELEAYCRQLGLIDHVIFCGWVKNVHLVYADLDILALTSLNEGTPVSIIEAMASSVPVIATDAGGVLDLLGTPDGIPSSNGFRVCERGILCRKDDALGFTKGLEYLVDLEAKNKRGLLARARSYVKERFSEERLIRDIESLYLDLMANRR